MKKILTIFATGLLMTAACTVHEISKPLPSGNAAQMDGVVAVVRDFDFSATRTSITQDGDNPPQFAWKEGDQIGIVPFDGETYQTNFKVKQIGSDPHTASFDGGQWSLKKGKSYAAYYPCIKEIVTSIDSVEISVAGQKQISNSSTAHLGDYDFMYAPAVSEQDGSVQLQFSHIIALIRIQVNAPADGEFTGATLKTTDNSFTVSGLTDLEDGSFVEPVKASSIDLELEGISAAKGAGMTFWIAALPSENLASKPLTLTLRANNGSTWSFDCGKGFAIESGKAYSVVASQQTTPDSATLTYGEITGTYAYGKPFSYTNDSGEWTICVYSNSTPSIGFQLNDGKVAYIRTPEFSSSISTISFETVKDYSGDIYLCSQSGSTSATGIIATFTGNGTKKMTYNVEDYDVSQVYIRSSKVLNISSITIELASGSGGEAEDTPFTRTSEIGFYESTSSTPVRTVGLPASGGQYSKSNTPEGRYFRFIDLSAGQVSSVKFSASVKNLGSTFTLSRIEEGNVNRVEEHTVKLVNKSGKLIWLEDKTDNTGYIIEVE